MPSYSLWLLLSACSVAFGAGSITYYSEFLYFTPKGTDPHGPFRVDIRYRQTYDQCLHFDSWTCAVGICGSEDRIEYNALDRTSYWCQTDAFMTRNLESNNPFEMQRSQGALGQLWTHVDLGTRSDTGIPNSSPVTAILPLIRIPANCPRTIHLLAHDPDADRVRCRYGLRQLDECHFCDQPSGFILDQVSCTLHYSSTRYRSTFCLEMVLEDFPMQTISLSYNDDSKATKSPSLMRKKRS
ncbi:hypothetical protein GJAV_G00228660, partial [Gymnothorax javanicus]